MLNALLTWASSCSVLGALKSVGSVEFEFEFELENEPEPAASWEDADGGISMCGKSVLGPVLTVLAVQMS
ncbi:hypothetical protein VM1G_11371 [Cytospora mali]|uniref:Uncharacterized protein n=1 Tax=Cytospora mali TaxID=578113 RepID=A0A194VPN1_CYTMA|nr:hypothetical protein VM1G_11371 [Valsa mali]